MLLLLLSICSGVKKAQNSIAESFFFGGKSHFPSERALAEGGARKRNYTAPRRREKGRQGFFDKLSCSFFSSVRTQFAESAAVAE